MESLEFFFISSTLSLMLLKSTGLVEIEPSSMSDFCFYITNRRFLISDIQSWATPHAAELSQQIEPSIKTESYKQIFEQLTPAN